LIELPMHIIRDHAAALFAGDDEDLASRSLARLLITASTRQRGETLARSIHGSGPRAHFPFVHIRAGELPVEQDVLKKYCTGVLAAAAGGSIFISAVDEMPLLAQDALVELLAAPERVRGTSAEVRLISGTTVSLLDQVAAGAFSERLFYQLNTLHVTVGYRPVTSRMSESIQ